MIDSPPPFFQYNANLQHHHRTRIEVNLGPHSRLEKQLAVPLPALWTKMPAMKPMCTTGTLLLVKVVCRGCNDDLWGGEYWVDKQNERAFKLWELMDGLRERARSFSLGDPSSYECFQRGLGDSVRRFEVLVRVDHPRILRQILNEVFPTRASATA
jgi:hypothetical protein